MFGTNNHPGYYHYATEWKPNRIGAILPLPEWTWEEDKAEQQAIELAKRGWPVVVFWCGLDESNNLK